MFGAVRREVTIPLIASGGANVAGDFTAAAKAGADAVLAASVFHFGKLTIAQVKEDMAAQGIEVRQ
jgi:cyclase